MSKKKKKETNKKEKSTMTSYQPLFNLLVLSRSETLLELDIFFHPKCQYKY